MKTIHLKTLRIKTKVLFLLTFCIVGFSSFAQKSVRIGYIDTEYILENVPEYQQATAQLDGKVKQWQTEIEKRLSNVEQMKIQLSNESVLLTKELIEEREEEIQIEENEILDYQQKRFGPNGDLIMQKKQLMQPIQDQIFAAVQQIASNRKYDFIFDKSADVVMLYSDNRFDISEQVLRSITQSSKRRQVSNRKEKKAAQEEEIVPEINTEQDERAKALNEKKAAREAAIEARRKKQLEIREAKKKELEERRKKTLEKRANRGAKDTPKETKSEETAKQKDSIPSTAKKAEGEKESKAETAAAKKLSQREARKKALEEKKKKILEARAKARKERLEKIKKAKKEKEEKTEEKSKEENKD